MWPSFCEIRIYIMYTWLRISYVLSLNFQLAGLTFVHFCPFKARPTNEPILADDVTKNNRLNVVGEREKKTFKLQTKHFCFNIKKSYSRQPCLSFPFYTYIFCCCCLQFPRKKEKKDFHCLLFSKQSLLSNAKQALCCDPTTTILYSLTHLVLQIAKRVNHVYYT